MIGFISLIRRRPSTSQQFNTLFWRVNSLRSQLNFGSPWSHKVVASMKKTYWNPWIVNTWKKKFPPSTRILSSTLKGWLICRINTTNMGGRHSSMILSHWEWSCRVNWKYPAKSPTYELFMSSIQANKTTKIFCRLMMHPMQNQK